MKYETNQLRSLISRNEYCTLVDISLLVTLCLPIAEKSITINKINEKTFEKILVCIELYHIKTKKTKQIHK